MCMNVYIHWVCMGLQRSEEGVWSTGDGATENCYKNSKCFELLSYRPSPILKILVIQNTINLVNKIYPAGIMLEAD